MSYGQQVSSSISGNNFFFELKPEPAWRAIYALAISVLVSLIAGGIIAIGVFPLASVIVGWFLYRRYPLFYCSFVWWMWFAGPVIRRIIDLRCGYFTPGPWTLTPILVTSISVWTLLKHLPKAYKYGGLPFVIASSGCFYGYLIRIVRDVGDIDRTVVILLSWLAPICFGFHLFMHWREYPSYRQNIQRTFLWGVLFMGFYGLVQYIFAPPWDVFWLKTMQASSGAGSFGSPTPFGMRVFSSTTSPQEFAVAIGAGLILLFCIRGSQQLLANGIGYLSFLLSLARSGWLSWLFGILVFFRTVKSNLQIRMLITALITILVLLPITTIEPFSTVISDRIESFTTPNDDGSLNSRTEAFNALFGEALLEFVGEGLQNPVEPDIDIKIKGAYVITDNGILVLLFCLGWIGTLPYVLSVALLIFQIRQANIKHKDVVLKACYAIILGIVSQIFFKIITDATMAMLLWGFIGLGMSARNYYLAKEKLLKIAK